MNKFMEYLKKWYSLSLLILLLFYFTCFNFVHPYHIGIKWDFITGELEKQKPGIYITAPWTRVSDIDLEPFRVCITSTSRSSNCLLVSFNEDKWQEFVKMQGFSYWWWNNRFSFNSGYDDEYRGFKDVLRGYAYGNKKYDFIIVEEDKYSK